MAAPMMRPTVMGGRGVADVDESAVDNKGSDGHDGSDIHIGSPLFLFEREKTPVGRRPPGVGA